jgi:chromate reductase, NAD(P)H dehydrogenase (quinone)
MITIICGTNRPNNETQKFVSIVEKILLERKENCQILSLEQLPKDFIFNNEIFGTNSPEFKILIDSYIKPVHKFIIISPEYNGSFPGVLKAFMDSVQPNYFYRKKAALIGVSSGRSGNLRGMDNLTGVLNYLQMYVLPEKIALANCYSLLDADGNMTHLPTLDVLKNQIAHFIEF